MEQSVHRPLIKSGLPIVRRANSAIGERVGLDLLRRPRRPVVTDSSIDPSTRCHPKIIVLLARPSGGAGSNLRARWLDQNITLHVDVVGHADLLLEPSAPASRFGHGCGGAVGWQLDHRRTQILAHLRP